MTCSNCGKDIPFEGRVCPYCHADKSDDKLFAASVRIYSGIGLLVGGAFGWYVKGFLLVGIGGILGFVAGALIGVILGRSAVAARRAERNARAQAVAQSVTTSTVTSHLDGSPFPAPPLTGRMATLEESVDPAQTGEAEERLIRLKRLFDQGLISAEEYQKRRNQILDQV